MEWKSIKTAPKDGTRILVTGRYWLNPETMYWRRTSSFWGGDIREFWALNRNGKQVYAFIMGHSSVSEPEFWIELPPIDEKT